MNVYVDDIGYRSHSIRRIVSAFKEYSPPTVTVVDDLLKADLVLIHVYGRINRVKQRIDYLTRAGKQYAIMQYTLRHSLNPKTDDWLDIWEGSAGVWSYLNLSKMANEDGNKFCCNFYYAPLGVDTKIFYPQNLEKKYQILTTGANYMTEGVRECVLASKDVGKFKSVHFGVPVNNPNVDSFTDASDDVYAKSLNESVYVAGLRRGEGFELPAAEGLVCGVRPILFAREHYTTWYSDLGIFVIENSREILINDLKNIFTGEEIPIKDYQIEDAKSRFNWSRLITGFWNNLWIH